ncbi:amidohydrolase family protein [Massilia phyllostachyos]|uniref:amidohydrolase family protein n=1 Tax=Massilia phyllostachyos TaxID=2898585 RepID=UPI003530FC99
MPTSSRVTCAPRSRSWSASRKGRSTCACRAGPTWCSRAPPRAWAGPPTCRPPSAWATAGRSRWRARSPQDAADVYGKGSFHLIDTLFSAGVLAGLDPDIVSDPRFILVPPNFVTNLQNAQPPTPAQIATLVNDATQQARVAAAGALVANGTDSPLVVPGISLHLNLRGAAMVRGNLAALQSVTRDAARIALVGEDLGTVEKGKLADLIAVRGDPLADVNAAEAVQFVVRNGRVITQDEILAPARTPQQLEARRQALAAQEPLCRDDPGHGAEGGGHAH